MPKPTKAKAAKKRVKVKQLSPSTKKLSTKEASKVQGGNIRYRTFTIVDRTN